MSTTIDVTLPDVWEEFDKLVFVKARPSGEAQRQIYELPTLRLLSDWAPYRVEPFESVDPDAEHVAFAGVRPDGSREFIENVRILVGEPDEAK